MGRMTEDTYKTLYEYGKKVFLKEISVGETAQKANKDNPEVALSSAEHYIN